jgi:uncharacterized membrane protein YccC
MGEQTRSWIARAAIGIAVGLALGVAIGWWIWPVTYTNTSPVALREDYRDDYVLMTATAYQARQDLEQARSRLERLTSEEPAALVIALAERLTEADGSRQEIGRLVRLAHALGVTDPALAPYLEGTP